MLTLGEIMKPIPTFMLTLVACILVQTACAQDATPPNLISFDFAPKSVDTSTSSKEITVTAHLTDDLSGVGSTQARFRSPSGNQIADVGFWPPGLVSGDELDGIYEGKLKLPQYSEQGTWEIEYILLMDNVGNTKWLDKDDAATMGFPTTFVIESEGDASPPNLISFDFAPKSVDTSTSLKEITVTAHLTDDLSGVGSIQARFRSPSGNQIADVGFWSPGLVSGDELDGIYEGKLKLPQHSEQGTWEIEYILLIDNVGNTKWLDKDDAAAMGFPTTFIIESEGDASPPNLISFDFAPKSVDTSSSLKEITVTAHLTDDLSGVGSTQARFRSPSGNQIADVGFWSPGLVSGDEMDGIYEGKLKLPQHSEQGTWEIEYILLIDNVGNTKWLDKDDAAAMGFPTEFRNDPISGGLSISGIKFSDQNSNSIRDPGESGVPDWTIELLRDSSIVETTITSTDGSYSFNNLGAGTYTIREVPQIGWTQTYPSENEHTVALSDKSSTDNDFGNHQLVDNDIEPPDILNFDFNPKSIDTSVSSQKITFTARLTDDLSGIGMRDDYSWYGSSASFISPSENQHASVSFNPQDRISGTDLDGVYESQMTMPQYSEKGIWKLSYVSISDRIGNNKHLNKEEMTALGFPTEFEVESIGDIEPPNLMSFDFDPKSIDTSVSSQMITFAVRLTDDLSGIGMRDDYSWYGSSASFISPSGNQHASVSFNPQDRISGTDLDGVYESQMTMPQYSEKGIWKLSYVSISDRIGNNKHLNKEEMAALGFPTEFEVESIGDIEPPNLMSFDFDPKSIDTSVSSQMITFTVRLTDDLSGIGMRDDYSWYGSSASFISPSGNQHASVSFNPQDRISGTDLDGVYESQMTMPQYSEKGIWKLSYVSISDRIGNNKHLNREEMAALGFPTEFDLIFGQEHEHLFLSGHKFLDRTNQGLPGWTIEVRNSSGLVNTTQTDGVGFWQVCSLTPGSYTVCEVLQPGWKNVTPLCMSVTLDIDNSEDNDFVNTPTMCINGSKINNCTGLGLEGWTIQLTDESGAVTSTTTDVNGDYWFCGLMLGNYTVCEQLLSGWKSVTPQCIYVTLSDSLNSEGNEFENIPPLCISGHEFNHCTGAGLDGWTINLKDGAGNILETTTTDNAGYYEFCGLEPGWYTVCEDRIPVGWTSFRDDLDSTVMSLPGTSASREDFETPKCIVVNLDYCEDATDNDFENIPTFCINGTIYSNSTTVANFPVKIENSDASLILSIPTDADGEYSFCGLKGGSYTVCVDKPGWTADEPCAIVYLDCQDEEHDFDVYKGRNNILPSIEQPAITLDESTKAIVPGAISVEPSGATEPDIGGDEEAGRQPAAPEIS